MSQESNEIKNLITATSFASEDDLSLIIDKLSSSETDPNSIDVVNDNYSEDKSDEQNQNVEGYANGSFDKEINVDELECTDSAFVLYLRNVADIVKKYPVLTQEKELELAKRISEGDKAAKETLINSNLRLVIYNAKKYKRCGVPIEDLVQDGNLGLCKAAEKYDYRKKYRFSTYATWWILQGIRNAVASKDGVIRVPLQMKKRAKKVQEINELFHEKKGRYPTIDEISKISGLSKRTIKTVLNIPICTTSIDSPVDDDNMTSIIDIFDAKTEKRLEDINDFSLMKKEIIKGLNTLDSRSRTAVIKYAQGYNMREIGEMFGGLTRERIHQILNDAYDKLRFNPNILKCLDIADIECNLVDANAQIEKNEEEKEECKNVL